ncbi:DUF6114 domain-containing protein [Streptomyces sp. NPDC001435]|uniref:DUF6114 domain-containing protein n=1 Tax=unclassified Streptomyces TaxID=2593676 RepID=UPI0036953D55
MTDRSPQGMRPAFRRWRARRPFWGGLLLALGGAEVLLTMKASMKVVMHVGMQGLAGYLLPTVMLLCGLLTLFSPAQRIFYSLIGVMASLATWLTSNLGGFFIGLLLGIIGSCLTFGWLPDQKPRVSRRQRRRLRKQEAARATAPALAEGTGEPV